MRCQHWQRGFAWRIEGKRRKGNSACSMWTMQKQIQPFPPTGDSNSPLIAFKISCCKFLHQPVNLLGLPRESKALQEHPQRRHKVFALKVHLIHVGIHHLFIETVIIPEEFSHLSLREQNTDASLINILQCNNTFETRKNPAEEPKHCEVCSGLCDNC